MVSRIRKGIILLILCIMLFPPTNLYAITKGKVGNLQPRADLNLTVNPLPRKVDLFIDADLLDPSWTRIEQLVNSELVPMLESKKVDYKITYYKTSGYVRDPLFWNGGYINDKGELYLYETTYKQSYDKVTVPNHATIISGTGQGFLLDDQGNLYCYENRYQTPKVHLIKTNTGLAKLMDGGKLTYGLTGTGDLYAISKNYNFSCTTSENHPHLIIAYLQSGIEDVAGTSSANYLAVTKEGNLISVGSGYPYKPSNLEEISELKIKQVAVIDGQQLYGGEYQRNGYILTTGGEVYSWGYYDSFVGRSATNASDYLTAKKIPLNEKIIKMTMSTYTSLTGSNYYTHEVVYLISESGNVYEVRQNTLLKRFTNVYDAYYNQVLYHTGVLKEGYYPAQVVSDRRETLHSSINKASWRSGAERYYLHISNTVGSQLTDETTASNIVTRLINNNIRYIGLSALDTDAIRSFIEAIGSKGKVVQMSGDIALNFRQIAQYIIKNQPVDVIFHIGTTSKDDLRSIEKQLKEKLVPVIEQYGIELKLTVTDGERAAEDRIYYLDSNKQIYVYDPRSNKKTQLTSTSADHAMIHHSGDLYYLSGTSIRRINTKTLEDTLYYTLNVTPVSKQFAVDISGNIWYQSQSGAYYYMNKLNPKTGVVQEVRNSYQTPFQQLRPGSVKDVVFLNINPSNGALSIAYPTGSSEYVNSFVQGLSGCINYAYGFMYPKIATCGANGNFDVWASILAPAAGDDFIWYSAGMFGNSDAVKYYNSKTGTSSVIINKNVTQLTSTPAGRFYYKLNNTTYWYDWTTGQTGTVSNINGTVIPYYHLNIDTRRLRKIPLAEGVQNAMWRTDADAYYVYMNDGSITALNSIASRLRSDKVSFIGLGTNSNKSQIQTFIQSQIDGYGTFISNTNMTTAISELATYLLNQAGLPKYVTNEQKVILEYDGGAYRSGELVFDPDYEDPENDPQHQERWIFAHDHTYYENSLGQLPEHNQTLTAPITGLTKPGKYTVTYEVSDRPKADTRFDDYIRWSEKSKLDIYAHRRPIADFAVTLRETGDNHYQLTLTDRSYDLDRQSKPNRGIAEWQWRWKKYSDAQWAIGQPPSIITGGSLYLISLRVKDEDGAWSDEKIVTLLAESFNNAPVAKFTVTSQIYHDQEYTIVDQSYDPDGDPIAARKWLVSKDGVTIYDSSTQPTAATLRSRAKSNGLSMYGTYTMTLTVRDNPAVGVAMWSEPYSQTFEVVNRPPVPGFTWTPATLYYGNTVQFKHAVSDLDNDPLQVRYQVTAPNGNVTYYPSSGTYSLAPANYNSNAFMISNLQGGTYTIVQTVSDGYVTKTLKKTMYVVPNRAPVADFIWTPAVIWEGDTVLFTNLSSDPDGDPLTYEWVITYPNGGQYTSSTTHPTVCLTQPGDHTVKLTVSDGRLTASKTQTLHVGQLTLAADVHHTEQWLAYHREAGHETTTNPKDFYSGEKFILTAVTESAPVRSLTATLTATDREGAAISVTVRLSEVQATSYRGEMYEDRFSSLERGLANGTYTIRFQVEYLNGTTKTADVPIRIIGHVLESAGVHRRR